MLNGINTGVISFNGIQKEKKAKSQQVFSGTITQDVFHKSAGIKKSAVAFTSQPDLSQSVENIFNRFNRPVVSKEQLNQWLGQFAEADRPTALKLLDQVDYHTFPDMVDETKQMHQILTDKLKKDGFDTNDFTNVDFSRIYSCKSGDVVSYIYRKANKIRNVNFKTIEALKGEDLEKNKERALVLIDDYIGTGVQFLSEFYACNPENRKLLNSYKKIYFLAVTANDVAIKKFDLLAQGNSDQVAGNICKEYEKSPEIQNEKERIFRDLAKIKGDKLELVPLHKEIPLLSPENPKLTDADRTELKQFLEKYNVYKYPFGVGNLQGHTTFFYSAPNTLPDILWNTKATAKCGFIPLFQRTEDISIYLAAKYVPQDKQVW